ncbi:MAG: transketolase [Elusimicrobia bacterium]|nr:transketolase [Elusimicrobiota bacterium]
MTPDCKEIRKSILLASQKSGHGHIPTCFSIVEILYAVYSTMKHDPSNPKLEDRDMFILSKGHGSLGLYCVLAKFGYFKPERVHAFGGFQSDFGCHVDRLKVPGVEASTGSLGHGIGIATGIALAFKIKNSKRRVFAIIGDGESNEGSVWEAMLVAVDRKLDNLTVIYDNNQSQLRSLQIKNPAAHFEGFGCAVTQVNGHDVNALKNELLKKADTVKIIIADTVKGYGCKTFIENQYSWHRRPPNEAEYEQLIKELG